MTGTAKPSRIATGVITGIGQDFFDVGGLPQRTSMCRNCPARCGAAIVKGETRDNPHRCHGANDWACAETLMQTARGVRILQDQLYLEAHTRREGCR